VSRLFTRLEAISYVLSRGKSFEYVRADYARRDGATRG